VPGQLSSGDTRANQTDSAHAPSGKSVAEAQEEDGGASKPLKGAADRDDKLARRSSQPLTHSIPVSQAGSTSGQAAAPSGAAVPLASEPAGNQRLSAP